MRPLARSPALRLRRALHVQAPDRGPPAPGRGRPAQEWPAAAVQAWARTRKTVLRSHKARSLEERDAVLSRFSTLELYFSSFQFPVLTSSEASCTPLRQTCPASTRSSLRTADRIPASDWPPSPAGASTPY